MAKEQIHQLRRRMLMKILNEEFEGNQSALARKAGRSQTLIWRYLTVGDNVKGMGERMARDLERKLGKTMYYLDGQAHSLQGSGHVRDEVAAALVDSRPVPLYSMSELNRVGGLGSAARAKRIGVVMGSKDLGISVVAMVVETDAMRPEFEAGDRVLVDPTIEPRAGDVVIALVDGQLLLRRYKPSESGQTFELASVNPNYAAVWSDRQKMEIQAVMVEHHRFRKT